MKKILFGLIATVMLSFAGNAQDLSKLSQDVDFKNYIVNEYNFNNNVSDINLLNELNLDSKLSKDELSSFYKLFSTTENSYNKYLFSQSAIMNTLEKKYSFSKYSKKELDGILTPVITEIYTNLNSSLTERRNCRGVYIASLALNASVAYGAHMACLGADVTVIGGIACHSAVAIGQAAANYIALEDYRDCMAN
jgi:hypothetical protein